MTTKSLALRGMGLCVAAMVIGCGQSPQGTFNFVSQKMEAAKASPTANADQAPARNEPVPFDADRKIIYNGTLDVQVKNLVEARTRLEEEMAKAKAMFAKTEITGDSGKRRVGHFVIKVPVANFQSLHAALAALGNPIKDQTDSQDVTDEFVDLTARVKNFKNEEVVLNKLLIDAGQRLDDVFKIREQISRNRLEVERIEGKLQSLEKLTSYSTLTVTLREIEEYHAPTAPTVEETLPNYGTEVTTMWRSSVSKLVYVFQVIGLGLIAITPWLPLILVVGMLVWFVTKSGPRKKATINTVIAELVKDGSKLPSSTAGEGPGSGDSFHGKTEVER